VQDVTTSSVIAYRFYEEGLRSFAVADFRAAERLFSASLAEDSSFAMAMHYSLLARIALHREIPLAQQDRLLQLANRASDRERLLIRGTVLILSNEHGLAAVAETLAARYPTEPDGHYLLGLARVNNGDFLAAISHLQRVVDLDSLGLRGTQARCRACDALEQIASAYLAADSPQAAERVARNWLRLQPASTRALFQLSASLQALDRNIEALAFYRRGATINPGQPHDAVYPALFRIRTGDFRDADRELGELSREATPDVAGDALWFLTISLRNQGRLREALTTVDELATRAIKSGTAAAQLRAQVLFEMGRSGQAAALFDSIARVPVAHFSEPYLARHRAWNLTHQATALAALGDTAALTVLTDSIRMWGRRSGFGRDWRLHHHSRGLLLATRGQLQAAAQEFRRAIYSPTSGYTRTNLELARVLMARKQAGEAVVVLRAALRGGLEASNLYVTRTELQEELGRAWEAAGERDSAAVQYRRVLHAWQQADPLLHARRARVAARLKALDVPVAARTRS
jgi:tetratricopeptide (TPR) repeat protein